MAYTDEAGEALVRSAFDAVETTGVDPDWEVRWRTFHHAVRVAGLWIGPPWERAADGEAAVVIEPGRAFGTGTHPTTRACVELLDGIDRGSVLDAGCGSGVLAIAASRLGFGPVTAVDVDPVAVEAARENAVRNRVDVDVRQVDVLVAQVPRADVLVANIALAPVNALLARSEARYAVTSGYLAREAPDAPGWTSIARMTLEGWAADALERAAEPRSASPTVMR